MMNMQRRLFNVAYRHVASLPNIIGLDKEVLVAKLEERGYKSHVAREVWRSLYINGVKSFTDVPNIGHQVQAELQDTYSIDRGAVVVEDISQDETRKWLIQFGKDRVETVYIPGYLEMDDAREWRTGSTICVSSQVGCTVGCTFCFTGQQKIVRNLNSSEIVSQVLTALSHLNDFGNSRHQNVQTIVFMGQGEPFYNYANVSKAIKILGDPHGLCFSKRKITISTSGVVPMIDRFNDDPDMEHVRLAISLHAVTDAVRDQLIPLNKQWPIAELLGACRRYKQKRRILFEYVMLDGVNDSIEDAKKLVELLKGISAVVNLIPFNSFPGARYKVSTKQAIADFQRTLQDNAIPAPVRYPKGDDIYAACGQLQTSNDKKHVFSQDDITSDEFGTVSNAIERQ